MNRVHQNVLYLSGEHGETTPTTTLGTDAAAVVLCITLPTYMYSAAPRLHLQRKNEVDYTTCLSTAVSRSLYSSCSAAQADGSQNQSAGMNCRWPKWTHVTACLHTENSASNLNYAAY